MKIRNCHERLIAAPQERVAELISDFDNVWPTELGPAPVPQAPRFYRTGSMIWQEVERPGAARAFRVVTPAQLRAEHWFELESRDGGTVLRHTVAGEPTAAGEKLWRECIESDHDPFIEALFDKAEAVVASEG